MSTDPLTPQEMVVQQNQEILRRLDSIESMLKRILYNSSPASLAVEEKGRILAAARLQGKEALKAAAKKINGM